MGNRIKEPDLMKPNRILNIWWIPLVETNIQVILTNYSLHDEHKFNTNFSFCLPK